MKFPLNGNKSNSEEEPVEGQELGSDDAGEELDRQLAELRDQLLRRTAEVDNMRRRHNEEREQLIYESNRRLIADLLPTLDDLERTIEHAKGQHESIIQGVELIHRNFLKVLERYGLEAMDVVGKPFDVHAHDALMQEVRDDVEPGTVLKEIQRGYTLHGSVVRHAKVIVAKSADE